MSEVILARPADSEGYLRVLVLEPIGQTQAGEVVHAELADEGEFEIVLHGQREFDVPDTVERLLFPDGTAWSPS